MAKLVIVESPAKAKTIGKYLGKDYEVTASMGHIRDLPASQLGIDIEHDYAPQYISIKGKEKLIKELKSKAKHSDGVLLATDPDREGEAISWHLANILGLDPHEPNRVTFDEITKKGVKEGMARPLYRYLYLHLLFQTLQNTSRYAFDADWNAPLPIISMIPLLR